MFVAGSESEFRALYRVCLLALVMLVLLYELVLQLNATPGGKTKRSGIRGGFSGAIGVLLPRDSARASFSMCFVTACLVIPLLFSLLHAPTAGGGTALAIAGAAMMLMLFCSFLGIKPGAVT